MVYINDETIENIIKEDIPYIDLTSLVLGINNQKGEIKFVSRGNAVISGSEEVVRIFNKLGIKNKTFRPSGTLVKSGDVIVHAQGNSDALHMGWKVSMNILEYCSGIATRTKKLVDKAKNINPKIEIVTTRKVFPGTKEFSIKAIIAGGASPHRLGLSETILIFKQHLNFIGGVSGLIENLEVIKARSCEKKVIVEVEDFETALILSKAGVDGLQFDKINPLELKKIVEAVRSINPSITLIGTGGINESNIEDYARTGINAISTTSVYFGTPVDIGVTITKL
ncbi:ModD protein [Clostridium estertheticum]|uniref:ModD protein n=1 Tax=Clostridium estertheticum TaxID=238834 RepID=UPI001C0C7ABB|nr:ModD protein [Clostridium estertheticum]MBU3213756.1 ModD protein [Clostridium estertheticum]WAG53645.1 ModD protein [Clostridium estertheticum]